MRGLELTLLGRFRAQLGGRPWKLAHTTHLELGHYGKALAYARHGLAQSRRLGVPAMHELSLAVLETVQRTVFDLTGARTTFLEEFGPLRHELGRPSDDRGRRRHRRPPRFDHRR